MLHRASQLIGHRLEASDGNIGKIKDLLFDDESWSIRYFLADTGRWLSGRRVLLSPRAILAARMDAKKLPVTLTKAQIESSPGIEADLPVSEQHQRDLHAYYGWPAYWSVAPYEMAGVAVPPPVAVTPPPGEPTGRPGDPHLRSVGEIKGYKIHAVDGTIGHVEDFLVDSETWSIRLLVVDTRNWLPGKHVVILPGAVDRVSWSQSEVAVHLTRDSIKDSPEYSPTEPLAQDYEQRLASYYDATTGVH